MKTTSLSPAVTHGAYADFSGAIEWICQKPCMICQELNIIMQDMFCRHLYLWSYNSKWSHLGSILDRCTTLIYVGCMYSRDPGSIPSGCTVSGHPVRFPVAAQLRSMLAAGNPETPDRFLAQKIFVFTLQTKVVCGCLPVTPLILYHSHPSSQLFLRSGLLGI